MAINYRPLDRNESNIYRGIRLESLKEFPDAFSATYEETSRIEKLSMEYSIENGTAEKFVLGAFDNSELIGISTFVKDENGIGNIYQMYIQKKYQGQNIGFGLLGNILKEAKKRFGEVTVSLEVSIKNSSAINLYKKAGFTIEASSHGSNTLVMTNKKI